MKYIINIIVFFNLVFNVFAEPVKNNENNEKLYQIKLLLIGYKESNYIEYKKNFVSDKYFENNPIIIKDNNCIVTNENLCIKYNFEHKLDTFNEYKKIIEKNRDYDVLSHLEWVQNISSKKHIKIKTGYDYSDDIINEEVLIDNIDILSSGSINRYEGTITIFKNKFFNAELILYERIKMKSIDFFSNDILVLKKYIINQRIKLDKITYIDRDNFGFIISVKEIKNDI